MNWIDELVSRSTARSKIAWKGELEFGGAKEDDRGGRTVQFRIVRRPDEIGSAHPFSAFTRRRGKRAGTIFRATIVAVFNSQPAYSGQLMLLGWSDGPQGSTVAFSVDPDGDRHPFMGYARSTRQAAGSRFMAVLLEEDSDGDIIDQEKRERLERNERTGKQQTLSNMAALILRNPRFHDWLQEHIDQVDWTFERADAWLKRTIGIGSKTELDDDRNTDKIAAFHKIRQRFVDWQEEQGGRPEHDYR